MHGNGAGAANEPPKYEELTRIAKANVFRYRSYIYDEDLGLYYLHNRYYDPETGRFISEDPARDGTNWYAYCNGDSVNYVDPTGLWRTVNLGYQAEPGDTLWGLSVKLFGNGAYWRDLGYPYDLNERSLQVGDIIAYDGGLIIHENGQTYVHVSNILYQNGAYHTPQPMPDPPKPAPPNPVVTPKPNTGSTPAPSTSSPGNGGGGGNKGGGSSGGSKPIYGPPVPPNLYGPPDSLKNYTFGIKDFDDKYKAVSTLILELAPDIIRAAKSKNVDAQVLAGVIFAENMLNVSFVDKYLEYPVYMGMPNLIDFSLGVAQVRISTAKYLEEKGYMPVIKGRWSFIVYFSANEIRAMLLQDNYYCILYAAAYLQLLADLWKDDFPTIELRPDIWGSLYNLGHGKKPHSNPQPNSFGELVGIYYDHMGELLYTYNKRG